jgi:hypothetical protein
VRFPTRTCSAEPRSAGPGIWTSRVPAIFRRKCWWVQNHQPEGCFFFRSFAHRTRAAFLAISWRFSDVIFFTRAFPPSCPN